MLYSASSSIKLSLTILVVHICVLRDFCDRNQYHCETWTAAANAHTAHLASAGLWNIQMNYADGPHYHITVLPRNPSFSIDTDKEYFLYLYHMLRTKVTLQKVWKTRIIIYFLFCLVWCPGQIKRIAPDQRINNTYTWDRLQ
jgi:hypothetical protein